jgi:DNA-binding PadR family transcriptional regulator
MHPYEMQRLIRDWHKDEFLDLKRGSLYHAIERLRRGDFIDPIETTREGRRPERTVYRLTDEGERLVSEWLRQLLAVPLREPTRFFAALSFLPHLSPQTVIEQLQQRASLLQEELAGMDMVIGTIGPKIGRLPLIEVEYARAMGQAELQWVQSFVSELRTGALTWDPDLVRRYAAQAPPPNFTEAKTK